MTILSGQRPGICSFCGGSTVIAIERGDTLCVGCERFGEGRFMGVRVGEHPEQQRLLELARRQLATIR